MSENVATQQRLVAGNEEAAGTCTETGEEYGPVVTHHWR